MPLQDELEDAIDIPLYNATFNEGEVKAHKPDAGGIERPAIISRERRGKYNVSVRLMTCVHGFMGKTEETPASLMIFDYEVKCQEPGRNFTSLETEIAFSSQSKEGELEILAFAPGDEKWNPSTGHIQEVKVVGGKVGASFAVTAGLEIGKHTTHFFEKKFFTELRVSRFERDTKVQWVMQENPGLKDGIPRSFKLAVLLRRPPATLFQGCFYIEVRGYSRYTFDQEVSRFLRRSDVEGDPIDFNPSLPPKGLPEGVDLNSLGDLCEGCHLRQLESNWGLDPIDWALTGCMN